MSHLLLKQLYLHEAAAIYILLDFSLTVNFNIHIWVWFGYFIC